LVQFSIKECKQLFIMKSILLLSLALLTVITSYEQFSGLKDKVFNGAGKLFDKGLSKKIMNEPITTSFNDCDKSKVLPVEFGKDSVKKLLCSVPYDSAKGFLLTPGFYKVVAKSFCLHAGTYAPSKGDGYLYAPLKGPKEQLVYKLINNWKNHPDINQRDLQLLLWAVIARTKFKDLDTRLKLVSARLLSEDDIDELSNVGIEYLSDAALKKAINNLPTPLQRIAEAENSMRQKFYAANVDYNEMESLAMLAGVQTETGNEISRGLWTLLPEGCYIRYMPYNYTKTYIEIYVPYTLGVNGIYFVGVGKVATPANISSQRLAQSNVITCDDIIGQ